MLGAIFMSVKPYSKRHEAANYGAFRSLIAVKPSVPEGEDERRLEGEDKTRGVIIQHRASCPRSGPVGAAAP
jgi:hypothetical protein